MKRNQQKAVTISMVVGIILILVGILSLSGAFRPAITNDGEPLNLFSWRKHVFEEPEEREFEGFPDHESQDEDLENAIMHLVEELDSSFEEILSSDPVKAVELGQFKDEGGFEVMEIFTEAIAVKVEAENGDLKYFQIPLEEGISISVDIDAEDPTSYLISGWHAESEEYNSPDNAITYDSEEGLFCNGEPVTMQRC